MGRGAGSAPDGVQTNQKAMRLEEHDDQLLPGIPNAIALALIAPKLPWKTFHILSSVSTHWQQAIQGRQVHEARASSGSTETLAVVNLESDVIRRSLALYSVRDRCFRQVPPIPQLERFPLYCQCAALDGKLYVLGGTKKGYLGSDEVYVLDLAGQRGWTQCSSMQHARHHFGCGVLNGKIYAFGGTSSYQPVCGSEVYDPAEDVWSPIAPMVSLRFKHLVTAVGEELVVHGGECYAPDWLKWKRMHGMPDQPDFEMGTAVVDVDGMHIEHPLSDHIVKSVSMEFYHPGKDEWRVADLPTRQQMDIVSLAQGELCALSWCCSYVRDVACERGWEKLHSFSCDQILRTDYDLYDPFATVVVDGELLGISHWFDEEEFYHHSCLVESTGISSGSVGVAWQKAQWSSALEKPFVMKYIMCTIQL